MSLSESFSERVADDMIRRNNQGNDVWPAPRVNLDGALSAFAPLILSRIDTAISIVGVSESAEILKFPSGLAELMYLIMHQPSSHSEACRQATAAELILQVLDVVRPPQKNERHTNRIATYTPKVFPLELIDLSTARALGQLSALLNVYCEFTFFAFVGFGKEIHGPYTTDIAHMEGARIVRNFFNLDSPNWNFSRSAELTSLELTTDYKDRRFTFDFMGRLDGSGSLPERALGAQLNVNGHDLPLTVEHINEVIDLLSKRLADAYCEENALDEQSLLRKLFDAILLYLEPLAHAAGIAPVTPEQYNLVLTRYEDEGYKTGISKALKRANSLSEPSRRATLKQILTPGDMLKWDVHEVSTS